MRRGRGRYRGRRWNKGSMDVFPPERELTKEEMPNISDKEYATQKALGSLPTTRDPTFCLKADGSTVIIGKAK